VTVSPENRNSVLSICRGWACRGAHGHVAAETRFRLGPIDLSLAELREAYEGGLPAARQYTTGLAERPQPRYGAITRLTDTAQPF
jgi:hypothetical protein